MVLIDALYINDGGGKVLLDYLVRNLEKTDKEIYYLFDNRIINNIPEIKKTNTVLFLKASLLNRHIFYNKNKNSFTSVLCFGNLPPNIRLNVCVYTYFHQLLFLKITGNLTIKQKILYSLKIKVLNFFKKNTDFWIVQTELVKKLFIEKYDVLDNKILMLPFHEELPETQSLLRKPKSYVYISNATPHKNHKLLIKAFEQFYLNHKIGELYLTVSEDYKEIYDLIIEKQKLNIPIINLGYVSRQEIGQIYLQSEFMIFPSLTESFGLPLVEAIEKGCKIIASDLPYTYAVCEPSIVFNPLNENEIINSLSLSQKINVKPSFSKVKNEINQLLELLV
jgi:glycosyltransferase involved in cell wall biosynthesis